MQFILITHFNNTNQRRMKIQILEHLNHDIIQIISIGTMFTHIHSDR